MEDNSLLVLGLDVRFLYLSMSQSCKEAAYFSQYTDRQLPRADLTRAEEQQG